MNITPDMNPFAIYRWTKLLFIGCILAVGCIACSSEKEVKTEADKPLDPKIEKLKLPDGFQAEHLYSPSDSSQGSWVAMTFDDRGRMITADQYGSLYRLELPAIGDTTQPKVEKIMMEDMERQDADTAKAKVRMGYAQGLLYAFNSLYVMVNHESDEDFDKNTGLYRLQDTNGDDHFDAITLIKTLTGEPGEHGPHSIVLSPDQQSLYIIAGNHTDIPKMDAYRLPPVWKDDNLFPQIKDPRGHANDRKAPGGWIAHIDSLGKHWELISAGFRNPFDLAFNEAGDMFTFDSDMEWDLGMPWYRPTRICHVTSGAEFGWRTGNGKWSPAYPDNLPALLNIGQGSPTNVIYGQHAKFPEQYRHSLFAFDWSFGIIYAIHLQPEGASYRAEKEEFISGMPLPLTDGVIGPDGALYFLTGGRKLDSDLYRVTYADTQDDQFMLASYEVPEETPEHKIRKQLEAYHGKPREGAVDFAWPYLNSPDRFVRYAARVAIEHQPVSQWQERVFQEQNPETRIQGMIALARHGDARHEDARHEAATKGNKKLQTRMLNALAEVPYDALTDAQQIDLLRAFELTLYRMGKPEAGARQKVMADLSPRYPASTDEQNRSLSKVLAWLEAPRAIESTLTLLEKEAGDEPAGGKAATASSDLILRNPQYGMDIAQMLKNMPAASHTYYATVLSGIKEGWTPALREQYFKWFYKAFDFQGGRSYIGFIDKAREKALSYVPKSKFDYYNELSGDSLLNSKGIDMANLPEPKGPGKDWRTEDIANLLDSGLVDASFEHGKDMYAATRCASCHTFRGDGGIIGPDLTQLGTRFSAKDMLESIINPNDVISDQYASTAFYLKNGQSVVGRLTNEDENTYYISQNPFAPEVIRELSKDEVAEHKRSAVSTMPPGLINSLSKQEVKDLLAYLMSAGNADHPVYSEELPGETAE